MPIYKRKNRSGKVVWRYQFALGATREKQELFWKSGYATKAEAVAAETTRRAEERCARPYRRRRRADADDLATLSEEFMKQYAKENFAPKTVEGYRDDGERTLAGTARDEHDRDHAANLSREWTRLLKSAAMTAGPRAARR